jgi:predicted nuclease of predicted toxin-antitoxin system
MKIKLDENLPLELVSLLRTKGHDVETVSQEQLVGAADADLFSHCVREGRLLMTQDLDFSDLRRFQPGSHSGVVLVRLRHPSRYALEQRLRVVLDACDLEEWDQCFVVVSDRKLRVRRPRVG